MTQEELAYLSVSCPLCKAASGRHCTMPKGAHYYRRDSEGKKRYAFHNMRKNRAAAIYRVHVTALGLDRLENRTLEKHPQVQRAQTIDGCKVIAVDFTRRKEGA